VCSSLRSNLLPGPCPGNRLDLRDEHTHGPGSRLDLRDEHTHGSESRLDLKD
jgi:hypothetical protein